MIYFQFEMFHMNVWLLLIDVLHVHVINLVPKNIYTSKTIKILPQCVY